MPTVETDGRKHLGWTTFSFGIEDTPNALPLIRTADQVYIFPLKSPSEPHRDDAHMRLLGPEARKALVRVLGQKSAWAQGLYSLVMLGQEPPNVGLIFRKNDEEIVLFFDSWPVAEGTVNGENTRGLLSNGKKRFEAWKRRYAKPELAAK